jgi:hypothetical protein
MMIKRAKEVAVSLHQKFMQIHTYWYPINTDEHSFLPILLKLARNVHNDKNRNLWGFEIKNIHIKKIFEYFSWCMFLGTARTVTLLSWKRNTRKFFSSFLTVLDNRIMSSF